MRRNPVAGAGRAGRIPKLAQLGDRRVAGHLMSSCRALFVLFLLLNACLQFRERVSIDGHGPAGVYVLSELDIAPATSPIPVGAGDPDAPTRMPGSYLGQSVVYCGHWNTFPPASPHDDRQEGAVPRAPRDTNG